MFKVGKHQDVYSRFLNLFTNKKILLGLLAVAIVAILIPTISFATEVMDAEGESLPEKVENAINEIIGKPSATPAAANADMSNYLCFEPAESGATVTFKFEKSWSPKDINKVYYSDDTGSTWKELVIGEPITINGPVYIKSYNPEGFNKDVNNNYEFNIDKNNKIKASGSVMSLIDGGEGTMYSISDIPYCFSNLFALCHGLITPPKLPATELSKACYEQMFFYCDGLQSAPELPALELCEASYESMFAYCSSLENPPALPAMNLAKECYYDMFESCSGLKTAPELPSQRVYESSYAYMFDDCSSIEYPPALPALQLDKSCYEGMFDGCTKLKTAPELSALELYESSYNCMFYGCIALEYSPLLPATKLAASCYYCMFVRCTGLKTAPELPATELAPSCYESMFQDCGELIVSPYLPAESLVEKCYWDMFSGCSKLNKVSVGFTSWNEDKQCTNGWLRDVPNTANCTFISPKVLAPETSPRDEGHVPSNWQFQYIVFANIAGYNNVYDGQPHGISVSPVDPVESLVTVQYRIDGSEWSTEPITKKDVGEYKIDYMLSADNYVTLEGSAMIVITPYTEANANFVGEPYTKMYGDKDPEFEINFTGLKGEDEPKLYEDYTIIREIGEDVTAVGEPHKVTFNWINPNYTIPSMETTLAITKTNKYKLVCDNVSKVAYEDDPSFTAHMEGLKFDDELLSTDYDIDTISSNANPSVITLKPKFSDTVSARLKNNYDINETTCFVNGTYKIYESPETSEFQFMVETYDSYYDGQEHTFRINVKNPASGAVVQYIKEGDADWHDDPYSFKDVGEYKITYKITHEGFAEVQDSATLKIQKAPATIAVDSCIKNQGEADPEFSARTTGLAEGESFAPGIDYALERQPGEEPGKYTIECRLQDNSVIDNYEITTLDSSLYITSSSGGAANPENINGASGAKTGDINAIIIIAIAIIGLASAGYVLSLKYRKQK